MTQGSPMSRPFSTLQVWHLVVSKRHLWRTIADRSAMNADGRCCSQQMTRNISQGTGVLSECCCALPAWALQTALPEVPCIIHEPQAKVRLFLVHCLLRTALPIGATTQVAPCSGQPPWGQWPAAVTAQSAGRLTHGLRCAAGGRQRQGAGHTASQTATRL